MDSAATGLFSGWHYECGGFTAAWVNVVVSLGLG